MKEIIFGFLKFAIFLVFFWNTGIVQLVQETEKDKEPKIERSWQEQMLLERQAKDFWSAKYRLAQDKERRGERYSPADYFADMTEFYLKFNGMSNGINSDINGCLALMGTDLRSDEAGSLDELTTARDKYYYATGQADKASDREEKFDPSKAYTAIWHWLVGMYWHNFIFAFLLFSLWDAERRDKITIKNPISILLNAIFHPLILAIIAYQYLSEKMIEAEYRRTKEKLLTVLSEDEMQAIKQAIRQGLSRQEFKAILKSKNIVVRHSLAWSLLATVVVTVLPMQLLSTQECNCADKEVTRLCVQSESVTVLIMANDSQDYHPDNSIALPQAIVYLVIFMETVFVQAERFLFREFILWQRIKHIPLLNS